MEVEVLLVLLVSLLIISQQKILKIKKLGDHYLWETVKLLLLDFKQALSIAQKVSVLLNHGLVEENLFSFHFHFHQQNNIGMIISQEEQIKHNHLKLLDLTLVLQRD